MCRQLPVCPDVVAWKRTARRDTALWIVEVETADSVIGHEARTQWVKYAAMDVPFSLAVPRGYGQTSWRLTVRFGMKRPDEPPKRGVT